MVNGAISPNVGADHGHAGSQMVRMNQSKGLNPYTSYTVFTSPLHPTCARKAQKSGLL